MGVPFVYLDIPMAESFSEVFLFSSISAIFRGKRGSKLHQTCKFGYLLFLKIWIFQNPLNTVCISLNTNSGRNFGKIWQHLGELGPKKTQKGQFHGCCIATKTFEIYNLTTTNAIRMKLSTIMYLHETFNLTKDWGISHRT